MSDFKPCAIVPVYNHGSTAEMVVKNLIDKNLPVIMVDDGSRSETAKELKRIDDVYDKCHLFTLDVNQGKGGAVMHGLKKAYDMGYSHALQVDADGQHEIDKVELFIGEARKSPESLICGYPVYDDSVPKSRASGRKLTTFFVSVETLSRDIVDAMCGFRVYPLADTHKLIRSKKLKRRMEFDIEILVRLHWMGMKMKFFPVKVIYPEDGISNFRMFHDNVAITGAHTMLVIGMILRLPLILARKIGASGRKNI